MGRPETKQINAEAPKTAEQPADTAEQTAEAPENGAETAEQPVETAKPTDDAAQNTVEAADTSAGTEKPRMPKRKKRSAASYALELLVKIVLTAAAVWALCTYVIAIHVNHSNAAYPMIKDGDLCITYRLGELKDGEEVSYLHDGNVCFGRIAAQSGDKVEIKNGYVSVDGYGVLEDVVYETTEVGSLIEYPYVVPDNCIFVLNDFRNDLTDSRTFGAVSLSDVEGKVVFVLRRRGI